MTHLFKIIYRDSPYSLGELRVRLISHGAGLGFSGKGAQHAQTRTQGNDEREVDVEDDSGKEEPCLAFEDEGEEAGISE